MNKRYLHFGLLTSVVGVLMALLLYAVDTTDVYKVGMIMAACGAALALYGGLFDEDDDDDDDDE